MTKIDFQFISTYYDCSLYSWQTNMWRKDLKEFDIVEVYFNKIKKNLKKVFLQFLNVVFQFFFCLECGLPIKYIDIDIP